MSGFPDFITARSKVWITTFVPLDWTGDRKVWQSSKVKSLDYIINVTAIPIVRSSFIEMYYMYMHVLVLSLDFLVILIY